MFTHRTAVRKYRITIADNYVAVFNPDDYLLASFYPNRGETMHEVEMRAMRWIDNTL